jgi:prepilin-type N-terminal cleavage/methylation domain-containing protein
MTRRNNRKGFTLIELLVVIAIIAILAAILFPVFTRVREKAKQTTCLSNIKQIALSTLIYCDDYDGFGPTRREGGPDGVIAWNEQLGAYGASWLNRKGEISGLWQCKAGAYTSYYSMPYNRAGFYMANSGVMWSIGAPKNPADVILICEVGVEYHPSKPALYASGSIGKPKGYWSAWAYYPMETGHASGNVEAFFDGHAKIITEDALAADPGMIWNYWE